MAISVAMLGGSGVETFNAGGSPNSSVMVVRLNSLTVNKLRRLRRGVSSAMILTILIRDGSMRRTNARLLMRAPGLKKSSILTAKLSDTCTTGAVRTSMGSLPLMT